MCLPVCDLPPSSLSVLVVDSLSCSVFHGQPCLPPASLSLGLSAFQFTSSCSLEFNLTALWQTQIYDLRKETTVNPWPASPSLPLNSSTCPSSRPLRFPHAPPLSPFTGSAVADNSSHSSNHNQCKASLEVFIVVDVVKVLMGHLKSGYK